MELVLLNPRLTAAQAREYGLVTAVYDVDDFDDEVHRPSRNGWRTARRGHSRSPRSC